jgi:GrpB-like predicted nucleotidyltransferase (UPF0157 family)
MDDAEMESEPAPTGTEYVVPRKRLDRPITLVEADPDWPRQFELLRADIRGALGEAALAVEHVGSTSVPGLKAKPILDICLTVEDPADEGRYLPALKDVGFELQHREPAWYEHRMLWHDDPSSHLHVFPSGCVEVDRMLLFRDRLRSHPPSLKRYAMAKQELASRTWAYGQDYADAKSEIIESILDEAR